MFFLQKLRKNGRQEGRRQIEAGSGGRREVWLSFYNCTYEIHEIHKICSLYINNFYELIGLMVLESHNPRSGRPYCFGNCNDVHDGKVLRHCRTFHSRRQGASVCVLLHTVSQSHQNLTMRANNPIPSNHLSMDIHPKIIIGLNSYHLSSINIKIWGANNFMGKTFKPKQHLRLRRL